jgi:hypothetical protein
MASRILGAEAGVIGGTGATGESVRPSCCQNRPVRLSRFGRSDQSGRTCAPTTPQAVHTSRRSMDSKVVSSGHASTFMRPLWQQCAPLTQKIRTCRMLWLRMLARVGMRDCSAIRTALPAPSVTRGAAGRHSGGCGDRTPATDLPMIFPARFAGKIVFQKCLILLGLLREARASPSV